MRCPHCHERMLKKSEDGEVLRTQGPIRILGDGQVVAQCYWCKSEVVLPLTRAPAPRVVVRPNGSSARR